MTVIKLKGFGQPEKPSAGMSQDARVGGRRRAVHFFACSHCDWWTDTDPLEAIARGQRLGSPFTVWAVPCGAGDSYQIEEYRPQVEGAMIIASYGFDDFDRACDEGGTV